VRNFKQLADVTLCFPSRGTILIEGQNEAGKSSLFEAVYFALYGKSLITDKDFKTEYLRTYGAEELCVELDFSIEGRPYSITRRHKGNQKAALALQREDGAHETINTLTAVNQRLMEELRISPESLLNTCFVEQKRLERLEGPEAGDRRATINELLNLRVLTVLQEESRVSREEYAVLHRLKGRVAIAQLDAQLPTLEAETRIALCCWLYSQLCDSIARWQEWQGEIETIQGRQATIGVRRAEIRQALAQCDALRARIQIIETDLTLRAHAWRDADTALRQATDALEQLQTLAAALPERRHLLNAQQALAVQLGALEDMEAEAVRLEQALAAKRTEATAFDRLKTEWEDGETQSRALEAKRQVQQQANDEAERCRQARIDANYRVERLNGILQQVQSYERAADTVTEIAMGLRQARTDADRLPDLRSRLSAVEALEVRLKQQEADRREQSRVQADLETLHLRQQDYDARLERMATLTSHLARLDSEIETATGTMDQAAGILQETALRLALETWAETAERCAEVSPNVVAETGLSGRIQDAEAQRKSAATTVEQVGRRPMLGYALWAAAALVGVAGFALGQATAGIVAAILLAAVGLMIVIKGQKAVRDARLRLNEATVACATLEGERRMIEAQAQANLAQYQTWQQREGEARAALMGLQAAVPGTPAEARVEIETLTTTAVSAAQTELRNAESALLALQTDHEIARRTLESEREESEKTDPEALSHGIELLTQERERLADALQAAADLPNLALSMGITTDPTAVSTTLQALRIEAAAAEAQRNAIAGLEGQHDAKQRLLEEILTGATALARELNLPGTEPKAWRDAAAAERTTRLREQSETPDDVLHTAVHAGLKTLSELEKQLAGLETEQGRRYRQLAAKPRQTLIQEMDALEQALTRNLHERTPLQDIRAELERDALPLTAQALNLHLATVRENLRRDAAEAEKLPSARQTQQDCRQSLEGKRAEFMRSWQETPAAPLPDSPDDALECLPEVQRDLECQLAEWDETALQAEGTALQNENSGLDNIRATRRHQQQEAVEHQRMLREQLGVGEEEAVDRLSSHLPELRHAAERDTSGWEQAVEEAETRCMEIRSRRQAQAQIYEVEQNRLELRAEEERAAQAEQEIAVKKRAGEIVEKTRQAIVSRVMPLTMQNVRQLLPLLTDGRYSDVKWDEAANTLEIYDTRARSYQRKRIFSGGARDQISLALRLGFALATLPGEHNVRPGWLFLDEPLSSFDRARTLALVELLTRGLIRREFSQIFLISHSESFDPGLFDHRLRMESGRIVEATFATTVI
jgi:DNA repair exonuclease SbcCD ATPase subunit